MAVTGVGNDYGSSAYENMYAVQKNETAKQTESKGAAAQSGVAAEIQNGKVSDYYSYLQKNYTCLSKGNVTIAGEYLEQCAGDSGKAKELEDFLRKIPELEQQGYEGLAARNKAMGGTVTYYQQSWIINKDGSVQSTVYSVTETGTTNAERLKKSMEERLERQKEKKTEEADTGSTRKTAADELTYLSELFDGYSFVSANYSIGMKYGASSTTNVMISPQFLAKMANDPELEAQYVKEISLMKELDEQFARTQAARGWKVEQGWVIDKDGGISKWGICRKDSNAKSFLQRLSEKSQEIREKGLEKKAQAEKIQKDIVNVAQQKHIWAITTNRNPRK